MGGRKPEQELITIDLVGERAMRVIREEPQRWRECLVCLRSLWESLASACSRIHDSSLPNSGPGRDMCFG